MYLLYILMANIRDPQNALYQHRYFLICLYINAYPRNPMDDLFKFSGDNIENVEKINLDELYEKKKEQDKNKLFTYNKILARIHEKIKLTSRQRRGRTQSRLRAEGQIRRRGQRLPGLSPQARVSMTLPSAAPVSASVRATSG